jgi:hypothetical protein
MRPTELVAPGQALFFLDCRRSAPRAEALPSTGAGSRGEQRENDHDGFVGNHGFPSAI